MVKITTLSKSLSATWRIQSLQIKSIYSHYVWLLANSSCISLANVPHFEDRHLHYQHTAPVPFNKCPVTGCRICQLQTPGKQQTSALIHIGLTGIRASGSDLSIFFAWDSAQSFADESGIIQLALSTCGFFSKSTDYRYVTLHFCRSTKR